MPKIIRKRCELVKLCHSNRSGPVFFLRHSVYLKKFNKVRRSDYFRRQTVPYIQLKTLTINNYNTHQNKTK